jgi:hypothetical protein
MCRDMKAAPVCSLTYVHVHALNGVCAPDCRPCPGYPSRRWKAQQAFCIGVSAADAESLMMWDDERRRSKRSLLGETIARSQPSGRVDHPLRHGSLYNPILRAPARWPVSRLSRLHVDLSSLKCCRNNHPITVLPRNSVYPPPPAT